MQPNPRKTASLRQLGKVDIAQLRDAVLAIPEAVRDAESQLDWRKSAGWPLWQEWRDPDWILARCQPVRRAK